MRIVSMFLVIILLLCTNAADCFTMQSRIKKLTFDKIVVEKSKRLMHVYNKSKLLKTYRISLGRNPVGAKKMEGDKRTPEGLYFIDGKNPNSNYHKNLGISYPNANDIQQAKKAGVKPGGQIKIHGLSKRDSKLGKLHLLTDWTAGCIAVTNDEIDELYNALAVGTPIEIRK